VTELFIPSHKLLPLFSPAGYTKTLEHTSVWEAVTSYIKSKDLTFKSDPRLDSNKICIVFNMEIIISWQC